MPLPLRKLRLLALQNDLASSCEYQRLQDVSIRGTPLTRSIDQQAGNKTQQASQDPLEHFILSSFIFFFHVTL